MITNINIGRKWSGQNLGNQLFQIAGMLGLSKRYKTDVIINNNWKYKDDFKLESFKFASDPIQPDCFINEKEYAFDLSQFDTFERQFGSRLVHVEGFFQSEKYWKNIESEVRNNLRFSFDLISQIYEEKKEFIKPESVAISVRRGDFIVNPNHFLLPFEYYVDALKAFFPPNADVVIFSDDYQWCKKQFSSLPNRIHYSEGYNAIEQLCFMSRFSNFVISNSTFSWWGAYLSENKSKVVVRPHEVFAGELKTKFNIKDHYPDDWIVFKHTDRKRSALVNFLFHNDNWYKIKYWTGVHFRRVYNKAPFLRKLNKQYKEMRLKKG